MKNKMEDKRDHHDMHSSRFAFWVISFMHENPILPIFRNPYKLLKKAGVKPGQKVVEVGCGPGFFTIPAAKIVGDDGLIYAVDLHPLAIKKVEEKIDREGIKNVRPILANASNTGLPDQDVDVAFLFGLHYVADGLENVLAEIHRILKPGGILSFEKTRGTERKLIEEVEKGGFVYSERRARVFIFNQVASEM